MHNFEKVIDIAANNLGDTRTASRKPSFDEFQAANGSHMTDVEDVMLEIAKLIRKAGLEHDYTKSFMNRSFMPTSARFSMDQLRSLLTWSGIKNISMKNDII